MHAVEDVTNKIQPLSATAVGAFVHGV